MKGRELSIGARLRRRAWTRQELQAEAEAWARKLRAEGLDLRLNRIVFHTNITHYEAAIGCEPGSSSGSTYIEFEPNRDYLKPPIWGKRYFKTSARTRGRVLCFYIDATEEIDVDQLRFWIVRQILGHCVRPQLPNAMEFWFAVELLGWHPQAGRLVYSTDDGVTDDCCVSG